MDSPLKPPVAQVKSHETTIHGETRVDNYYWLREKTNPDVIAHLEAENAYTKQMMAHTDDFQKQLFEEMKNRIQEDDISAPEKLGDYFYYSRTIKDKQYKTYHRRKGSQEAHEELLLDGNQLAEGLEYFRLGVFKISPDHQFLAYSVDLNGSEEYTIYIKNLLTGEILPEQITNTSYGFEWANDNQTFFYTVLNDIKQPDKVYKHTMGADPSTDVLIYQEADQKYYLSLEVSADRQYLFITLASQLTSEVRFLALEDLAGKLQVIHPRTFELEYYCEHWEGQFFIRTNADKATNFKLMITPTITPGKDHWKELIPHRENVLLTQIRMYADHLVLYEREDGLVKIRVHNHRTKADHYVDLPEPIYGIPSVYPSLVAPDYASTTLRFPYTSLITPSTAFDYEMDTKILTTVKQEPVLGGYDPDSYITERVVATAPDGATVYLSVVYKKGMVKNGQNWLLLYGYGSYGYNIEPTFIHYRLSLLERGFIFAIAHVRGSSYMGRKWYDDGKLFKKMNTFTDFIACAEHLIQTGYTSPDHLVISGGSAGGLLMGVVANLRPDLFKAVLAAVPFVDAVNTMLDASIPLTVLEYEEWGNPEQKEYYDYIKSYSPYDNVTAKEYPNLLVTAGLNDPRVQYWEPTKWVAKLRASKTDQNLLLLKTEMGSGHAGKSGRYDYLKEIALRYAFVLDLMQK